MNNINKEKAPSPEKGPGRLPHSKDKELFLECLRKTPIVQIACEKTGMARSTYYYLRKHDPEFAKAADAALAAGKDLGNDAAESALLTAIRNGNITAAIYWLKNHHKEYKERLELSGEIEQQVRLELTEEEIKLLEQAIALSLPQEEKPEDEKETQEEKKEAREEPKTEPKNDHES